MENLSRRSFVGGAVAAGIAAGTVAASAAVADETAQQAPAEIGKHTWEVAPDPITDIAQTYDFDVVVVGGGDSACEEAAYLATICRKVYMIVRKDRFRASKAMQERVMTTPNIEIRFETTTQEVLGDDSGVTGVRVRRADGREEELGVTGFFVVIGHQPNTEIFRGSLELDDEGYIKTAPGSCRTNIVGVFAAGDVQDPHYRQAITAAGSGCAAALECERFLLQL